MFGHDATMFLHYWKKSIFSDVISVENPLSMFRIMVPTLLVNGFSRVRIFGNQVEVEEDLVDGW